VTAASDPWCVIDRGKEAGVLRQLLIMFAGIAAALSLANLGAGGGP
jgi:hypothetical protein